MGAWTYCLRIATVLEISKRDPDSLWKTIHLLVRRTRVPYLLDCAVGKQKTERFGLRDGTTGYLGQVKRSYDQFRVQQTPPREGEASLRLTFARSVRQGRLSMVIPRPCSIAFVASSAFWKR